MPLFSFEGKSPKIHPTAFIAPTAVIVGDVTIEERASVWYNAVVRADFSPIVIRAEPRRIIQFDFGQRQRQSSSSKQGR